MKKIVWSAPARADVRGLSREAAMHIFEALVRFAEGGEGDVRKLRGQSGELRLRVGDYRVRFTETEGDTLQIHAVRHRKEAYR